MPDPIPYLTNDQELTSIADAIRTRGGTSATLEYPTDFVSAIEAIPSGGDVNVETSKSYTVSASGAQTISPSMGYDAMAAVVLSVPAGSATTPSATILVEPEIIVDSAGLVSATISEQKSLTPTVSAGYVSSGTAGTISISGSNTSQLSTQSGGTITPIEAEQTAVAAGKYTLGAVKVGAISSTYVGSGIDQNDSTDLTVSGATVTAPAGYYAENASASVSSGSATTPATTITANPSISFDDSTGIITATNNKTQSVTPTVSEGYITSGTAGTVTVNGSNTQQLTIGDSLEWGDAPYSITISLTNPINPSYFKDFQIYKLSSAYVIPDPDEYYLMELSSASSSTTVSLNVINYGLACYIDSSSVDGYALGTITCTGGVERVIVAGADVHIFHVTGNGTITFNGINWNDD